MMQEYSVPLGQAVRAARNRLKLTQNEIAEQISVDSRTILNIENHKGNPKMAVLFPLVRALELDPNMIFYPEVASPNPATHELSILLSQCTEKEAEALLPICKTVLSALKSGTPIIDK